MRDLLDGIWKVVTLSLLSYLMRSRVWLKEMVKYSDTNVEE